MPARSSAALIAIPPSSAPLKSLSEPSNRPIAVLAPPTITASPIAATIQRSRPWPCPVAGKHQTRVAEERVLTRIDHVGIACRNLIATAEFYEATFGLTVVSRETNAEQGVREAMLVVGDAPAGTSYVQLLEPLGPDTPVGQS